MESAEQREFVKWFKETWPEHTNSLRCSMNGLKRTGRRQGAKMWSLMKSQGAIESEADIALLIPKGGFGAFLAEHKGEGMPRKVEPGQQDYLDYHNSIGNKALSTRGLNELKTAVIEYMEL